MDPFSHAIVGATAALRACKPTETMKLAVLCGVLSGMAPDLDILIRQAGNPMLGLGFHRHFTHSLAFIPIGAAIVAVFIHLLLRKRHSFRLLYVFCLIGYGLHGLLDSMTNYGTHLFWPFTNRRESWSIISIIDPIFTLTALTLLVLAARRRSRRMAAIGAFWIVAYLGLGWVQKIQATSAMMAWAAERGHMVKRHEVKPSFGNIIVWRGQYLAQGRIYTDAYHISPWRGVVRYEGGSLPIYTPPANISPTQTQDLAFFTFFSDGWLAEAPKHKGLIGDARFSMLPNGRDPVWGIRLQPESPENHVLLENVRTRTEGDVGILFTMILGGNLAP
jgi:inner membrane protein